MLVAPLNAERRLLAGKKRLCVRNKRQSAPGGTKSRTTEQPGNRGSGEESHLKMLRDYRQNPRRNTTLDWPISRSMFAFSPRISMSFLDIGGDNALMDIVITFAERTI